MDELTINSEASKSFDDYFKPLPTDIKEKIIDIYNYMAKEKLGKVTIQFENGIKINCEIDDSEWKDIPRINLEEVLNGKNNEIR